MIPFFEWSVEMVTTKGSHRYWRIHFSLVLLGFTLGTYLIALGLFASIPPNACNTPGVTIVFNDLITGDLSPSTPNITTHLGHCTQIQIYSFETYPFTLQILDEEGNLYASFPQFANDTLNHQLAYLELFYNDYFLLALYETSYAAVNLSVTAIYISPVLPCIDLSYFIIRWWLPATGLFLLSFAIYSATRIYHFLRYP
jgi:hypothetical protein